MTLHLSVALHVYASLPRVDEGEESLKYLWGKAKLEVTDAVLSQGLLEDGALSSRKVVKIKL